MAQLPLYTQNLDEESAHAAREGQDYLDFNPSGRWFKEDYQVKDPSKQFFYGGHVYNYGPGGGTSYDRGATRAGQSLPTPFAAYGLGNDPYDLLARQYAASGLLRPENNRYATLAAIDAGRMSSGQAGYSLGKPVQGAIDAQTAAANNIQTAGSRMVPGQNMQLAQTMKDLNVVRNSALGTGPSAAQELARAQLDQNIRAQSAMAATARGGNIAAAQRTAAGAGQNMMLQSQAQMAAQRAQEQLNAQSLLTQGNAAFNQSVGAARNTDINQAISTGNALDRSAVNQQALAGFQGNMLLGGQQALGNSADRYDAEIARYLQARMQAANAVTGYGLQKYSLDLGLPMAAMGPQANLSIANQEDARQRQAALINAASSAAAASAQLIK